VLTRDHARPKGADAEVYFSGAPVWTVRNGKVARIEFYWNRADGLQPWGSRCREGFYIEAELP
jgi:ketosteroid isomerase-like protein